MIFIITSDTSAVESKVVSHLAARSLSPISLSAGAPADLLGALDSARHYLVHDVPDLSEITKLLPQGNYRILSLGNDKIPEAHLRLSGEESDLMPRIEQFVTEAMSSFERPGWDEYFMDIAKVVGRRSNCMKRQVAAVVVRDRRIVATGYNGTPRGAKNCNEGGCPRCNDLAPAGSALDDCLCNHAEENAVAQAAYHGISIRGATIYCTFSPCLRCTKLIINAGIAEVVYNARYDIDNRSLSLLAECGVEVRPVQKS